MLILATAIMVAPAHAQKNPILAKMEAEIAAENFGAITSVVVRQNGKLLVERYFDDGGKDALRNTRSATKTITGMLAGIAIADGHISSVNQPIYSFYSGRKFANPDSRKEKITLENLLTMTTGLECNDWNNPSRGNEERMYLIEDWEEFFLDLPLGFPPPWETPASERPNGRVFSYCTAGVFTLGAIVERASATRLEEYAQQRLFGPVGITEVKWPFSPLGIAQGGGGLELKSGDLAKLGQLYLNGGRWNGTQVIPEDWVSRSVQPYVTINESIGQNYGYLWWLQSFRSGDVEFPVWMMSGTGGNKQYIIPSMDAVVVVTTTNFRRPDAHQLTDKLLTEYIIQALGGAN
ncbi:serine hydrolase domain-containing protein [Parasphingorhabdus halotolerans]|nr:serine hydrolase [Parasphingorhabdus halotolerans]